jgi:hypothetical protein
MLSAMPTLATLSAAHLSAVLFPATLCRLYIARDNNPAGEGVIKTLIDRATDAGVEAITLSPHLRDFNEDLRTFGTGELRAQLRVQIAPEDVARFVEHAAMAAKGRWEATRGPFVVGHLADFPVGRGRARGLLERATCAADGSAPQWRLAGYFPPRAAL